jgi:hypothetical protein
MEKTATLTKELVIPIHDNLYLQAEQLKRFNSILSGSRSLNQASDA